MVARELLRLISAVGRLLTAFARTIESRAIRSTRLSDTNAAISRAVNSPRIEWIRSSLAERSRSCQRLTSSRYSSFSIWTMNGSLWSYCGLFTRNRTSRATRGETFSPKPTRECLLLRKASPLPTETTPTKSDTTTTQPTSFLASWLTISLPHRAICPCFIRAAPEFAWLNLDQAIPIEQYR